MDLEIYNMCRSLRFHRPDCVFLPAVSFADEAAVAVAAGVGAKVSYDELMARPAETLERLCVFLGVEEPAVDLKSIVPAPRGRKVNPDVEAVLARLAAAAP